MADRDTTPAERERALPDEIREARLAYANACERMGMAHANGTRAEWLSAVDEEIATRRALESAILAALREAREGAERERDEARKDLDAVGHGLGICYCHDHGCGGSGPVESIVQSVRDDRRERDDALDSLAALRSERDALAAALRSAEAALVRAREALNHDRTGLAAAVNRIQTELRGRYWMRHEKDGGEAGSWGSYPYTQHTVDTLRREISWAFGAMATWAEKALNASGNLAGVEILAMEEPLGVVRRALATSGSAPVAPAREPHAHNCASVVGGKSRCDCPAAPVAPEGRTRALYDVLWQAREILGRCNLDGSATLGRRRVQPLRDAVAAFDAADSAIARAPETPAPSGEPRCVYCGGREGQHDPEQDCPYDGHVEVEP
jgi:hypothetical protein